MYNKHFVDPLEINTQAVPSFDRLGTGTTGLPSYANLDNPSLINLEKEEPRSIPPKQI